MRPTLSENVLLLDWKLPVLQVQNHVDRIGVLAIPAQAARFDSPAVKTQFFIEPFRLRRNIVNHQLNLIQIFPRSRMPNGGLHQHFANSIPSVNRADKHRDNHALVSPLDAFTSQDPNGADKPVVHERAEECSVVTDLQPVEGGGDESIEFIRNG